MEDELIEQLRQIDGAVIGEGAFSPGPAVWVGTREVAHFDANGALDVRLTKAVIREQRSVLKADDRVTLRGSGSDWLEIRVVVKPDLEFAVAMVKVAVASNLPTANPGLPPTGAEL